MTTTHANRVRSPLGDSREHPVGCTICQRSTWNLSAVCDRCIDEVAR